jgi:hypothetical protein
MLLGRAQELVALDALLAGLRAGRGRAIVIEARRGSASRRCWRPLAERCGDDVSVLRAGGVEHEVDLAFAGVSRARPCRRSAEYDRTLRSRFQASARRIGEPVWSTNYQAESYGVEPSAFSRSTAPMRSCGRRSAYLTEAGSGG